MIRGFREFEFDLPDALLTELKTVLDNLESAPLTGSNVKSVPEQQGVYQLFYSDKLVYIGKTDAQAGLRQRLDRHLWTVQHRKNLDDRKISFKAVRIFVFTAIDLETQLIAASGGAKSVSWNGSGFGANDPGRERDTTKPKPEGFDALYPLDIDIPLTIAPLPSNTTAADALTALKSAVPYVLRFESQKRSRKPHQELVRSNIKLSKASKSAREILTEVIAQLPKGWQATQLPGRIIIYREDRHYDFGSVIAKK